MQMSKSPSRRFPVTVTKLPVTCCQICHRTVAYRPGSLSEVLTEHYRRAQPEALGLPFPVASAVSLPAWKCSLRSDTTASRSASDALIAAGR
jgi:hypothetical protein